MTTTGHGQRRLPQRRLAHRLPGSHCRLVGCGVPGGQTVAVSFGMLDGVGRAGSQENRHFYMIRSRVLVEAA
jgi:hypothetical protein